MEFLKSLTNRLKTQKPKNNKKEKESKKPEKFIYTKTKKIPAKKNQKLSNIVKKKIAKKKILEEKEEHFFDNDYINACNTKKENSNHNNKNNDAVNNKHNSFCISINNNYTYNLSINTLDELENKVENKNPKNLKINFPKNDIEKDNEEEFTFNQKKEITNEEKTAEFPDIINNDQKEYFLKTRTLTKGRFDYSTLDNSNKNIINQKNKPIKKMITSKKLCKKKIIGSPIINEPNTTRHYIYNKTPKILCRSNGKIKKRFQKNKINVFEQDKIQEIKIVLNHERRNSGFIYSNQNKVLNKTMTSFFKEKNTNNKLKNKNIIYRNKNMEAINNLVNKTCTSFCINDYDKNYATLENTKSKSNENGIFEDVNASITKEEEDDLKKNLNISSILYKNSKKTLLKKTKTSFNFKKPKNRIKSKVINKVSKFEKKYNYFIKRPIVKKFYCCKVIKSKTIKKPINNFCFCEKYYYKNLQKPVVNNCYYEKNYIINEMYFSKKNDVSNLKCKTSKRRNKNLYINLLKKQDLTEDYNTDKIINKTD